MSSGRRESVMIFCISPISRLYLDPIEYYGPDTVHAFIGDGDDPLSELQRRIYDSSKEDIECKKVTEHRLDITDYDAVLGEIVDIMSQLRDRYGDDLDIFINISSGTPEFSAAGMFASMLPLSAKAFRVDTTSTLTAEEMSGIIERINDTILISEPKMVTGLKNDAPDEEMIVFLNIVDDLLHQTRYPKYRTIIQRLKDDDVWSYDPGRKSGYGRTSLEEKEERYLQRHYISKALENGWLERPSSRTMRITESGKAYISVFGSKPDHHKVIGSVPMENPMDECRCMALPEDLFDDLNDEEPNRVTIVSKKKRYTFTIGMDQHNQHP